MKKKIEVTSENFGDLLIRGLEEALAIEEGRAEPARVRKRVVTAREATAAPPPRYDAERIARVRRRLNVSQPVFASILNVSDSTVKAWEQGTREPEGPTRRLLEVAERHPEALVGAGGATRVRETNRAGYDARPTSPKGRSGRGQKKDRET